MPKFPTDTPDITPALNDRVLVSDTSNGWLAWDVLLSDLPVPTSVQDLLDEKASISWQVFTGSISATNLSGTNTGDNATNTTSNAYALTTPDFYQYSISRTVSGGNLTVSLLNFEWNTPTATKPVKIMIGGVVRTVSSALSLVSNAWQSYLNLWSAELATKECDIFVYIRWDTWANAVCIDISRYPSATVTWDFVQSWLAEKWYLVSSFAWSASTDVEKNIGRFNAILSGGAGYTWSIPATSDIRNYPIYSTRTLSGWTQTWWTANNLIFYYTINWDRLDFSFDANGTSNSTASYITLPFSARTIMAHDFALGLTYDNWVDMTTPWRADLYGQYINLYKDSAYWAWTASGAKIIRWQWHYYI